MTNEALLEIERRLREAHAAWERADLEHSRVVELIGVYIRRACAVCDDELRREISSRPSPRASI